MKIEFELPCRQDRLAETSVTAPVEPRRRAPRVARLLALAHKLDGMVRSGQVAGYREVARLGQISSARLSQILTLLHLSPEIQEYILFASPAEARLLAEYDLRQIAREPDWNRQQAIFASRCQKK